MRRNIVITGASSGIGAALARLYAEAPSRLLLIGRDAARLSEVAEDARAKGAEVQEAQIDVVDAEAMKAALIAFDEAYPAIAWLCWVPNLVVAEWLVIGSEIAPLEPPVGEGA